MSRPVITEANRPYRPYGAVEKLFYCKDDEILIEGPAGTGKSVGVLNKAHVIAEKYPGARLLFARKTRASLTDTALVSFEAKVVPAEHPILLGAQRTSRHNYVYPNGSEIVLAGFDKPSKIMSSEYDFIYIQEGIECAENDIEMATTRLRNGVVPYQQLVIDTNPDKPNHWLNQRAESGRMTRLLSRLEENPQFFDQKTMKLTPSGQAYIAKLDRLTGARYQRLRLGKWAAAEGIVYESWDAAVHLIDRFPIPKTWRRVWVIDFGYTNPFVWQQWAIDHDGRAFREREIYFAGRLVEDHAKDILAATKYDPDPEIVICDHDAEDRATLERHLGHQTFPAVKAISEGIQFVQSRLRKGGDGKPRIFYLRDSLWELDQKLVDESLPTCTEQEYDGYIWDIRDGKKKGEVPVDKDNHGMDTTRYLAQYLDGEEVYDGWSDFHAANTH